MSLIFFYQEATNGASIDYDPNFGDFISWGVIWHLGMRLKNKSGDDWFDTRGIVLSMDGENDIIGLHNADGLTTLWGTDEDDWNPFKYCGTVPIDQYYFSIFDIEFPIPEEATIDCSDCTQDPSTPPNPEQILDNVDDKWINFALDYWDPPEPPAEQFPKGPTLIHFTQYFVPESGPCDTDGIAYFHAIVQGYDTPCVSTVRIDLSSVPGHSSEALVNLTYDSGTQLWNGSVEYENVGHEGIYTAQIIAYWTADGNPDPEKNPEQMRKDVRLLMGDFNCMLDNLFDEPTTNEIEAVYDEWDSRIDGIYHDYDDDDFTIINSYTKGSSPLETHYVRISHNVGGLTHEGIVRVPSLNMAPEEGYPIMLTCHFGRWACDDGAKDPFYSDFKNDFVELIPVYRGNGLCYDGGLVSEYDDEVNSPADLDVDDVLGFLDAVCGSVAGIESAVGWTEEWDLIDTDRVGIMGGSRGGSPTYLAKLRDHYYGKDQIDRAMVIYGSVSDFSLNQIKNSCLLYIYNNGYIPQTHYFNEEYIYFARVLEEYLHGNITMAEARNRMFLNSPFWFAPWNLTNTDIHHGVADNVVSPLQSFHMMNMEPWGVTVHMYQAPSSHVPQLNDVDSLHPGDAPNNTFADYTSTWLEQVIDGD